MKDLILTVIVMLGLFLGGSVVAQTPKPAPKVVKPDVVEVVAENSIDGKPKPPSSVVFDKELTTTVMDFKKAAEDLDREEELLRLRIELAQRDLKDTQRKKSEAVSLYQNTLKNGLLKNGVPESLLDEYAGSPKDGVLTFNLIEKPVNKSVK